MGASESRIAQRHRFEARFGIRLERDGRKLAFEGWARDISESGLGAFVGQTLTLGESVSLEIPNARTGQIVSPRHGDSLFRNSIRVPVHRFDRRAAKRNSRRRPGNTVNADP